METVELKCALRTTTGTGKARNLRRQGYIPATCYGRALEPINLSLVSSELAAALSGAHGNNALLELVVEGAPQPKYLVMLKDQQRHPLTRRIIHADFHVLETERPVQVDVPLVLEGRSPGVAMGGKLRQVVRTVRVECLPEHIPARIVFDISSMQLKERALVNQIVPPEHVKLVYVKNYTICDVSMARGVENPAEGKEKV
ncbi:MAG: 50S ribosomal protein L25 [Myxococcota bacterium]|jgi:large subunit ribosomal protein L25|nr:50S ribosomal protein L25 [Myxococcota bacterium]